MLHEKEQIYEELIVLRQQAKEGQSIEEVQKIKIKSLQDENHYMKSQYVMELEALRSENIELHNRMRDHSREVRRHHGAK